MIRRATRLVAVLSLFALANCGGGDGAGNASCRGILKAYADCGVFEGGTLTCHAVAERDLDVCIAACVNEAECDDIVEYVCDDDPNGCIANCFDEEFSCDDGESIDTQFQCDGIADCEDGSDEDGCDPSKFRCAQFGEEISGNRVCDGTFDCPNGADEDEIECGEYTCLLVQPDDAAQAAAGDPLPYTAASAE